MADIDKKQLLLQSAREEFLEYGYQKASLRRICKKANMTTGAIYFFFTDKAGLFDELVKDVVNKLEDIIHENANMQMRNYDDTLLFESYFSKKLGIDIINLYYDHPVEVKLLLQKSEGSHFENFNEILQGFIEQRIRALVELKVKDEKKVFTNQLIGWLSHAEVDGFLYALHMHLSREETLSMVDHIVSYLIAGFNRLYQAEMENDQ